MIITTARMAMRIELEQQKETTSPKPKAAIIAPQFICPRLPRHLIKNTTVIAFITYYDGGSIRLLIFVGNYNQQRSLFNSCLTLRGNNKIACGKGIVREE